MLPITLLELPEGLVELAVYTRAGLVSSHLLSQLLDPLLHGERRRWRSRRLTEPIEDRVGSNVAAMHVSHEVLQTTCARNGATVWRRRPNDLLVASGGRVQGERDRPFLLFDCIC